MAWQETAEKHRSRIAATIPDEWRLTSVPSGDSVMSVPRDSGLLTPEELAITESTATDLVAKMAARELTSVAVTMAFCKRAALAHQLVRPSPLAAQARPDCPPSVPALNDIGGLTC
jgi:amidase